MVLAHDLIAMDLAIKIYFRFIIMEKGYNLKENKIQHVPKSQVKKEEANIYKRNGKS
jgi:hypothetical protein